MVLGAMHSPASWANMPKGKAKKGKLETEVLPLLLLAARGRPKIGGLHEEIDVQSSRQAHFIVDPELAMRWVCFVEWPSIKASVHK